MKRIERALKELKQTVSTIVFLSALLDSFVVLALFILLFRLMSVRWYWAFIPFGLYLLVHAFTSIKKARLDVVEKKVPMLKEQLTTAADTVQVENPIVAALQEEVIAKMRQIKNSYFIPFGKLTTRVSTLVVICFLIIFVAATDVQLLDAGKALEGLQKLRPFQRYDVDKSLLKLQENESLEGILGNKSLAELGYQKISLKINPVESDIDISRIGDPKSQQFSQNTPEEIYASTDASYEENIPKNYRKIVRNYFSKVAQAT